MFIRPARHEIAGQQPFHGAWRTTRQKSASVQSVARPGGLNHQGWSIPGLNANLRPLRGPFRRPRVAREANASRCSTGIASGWIALPG
jgi:hypothetical protein